MGKSLKTGTTILLVAVLGSLYYYIYLRKSSRLQFSELTNVFQSSETMLLPKPCVLEERYYQDNNSRILFVKDLEDNIKTGRNDLAFWRDLNVLRTKLPGTVQTMRNPCWWSQHRPRTTCDKMKLMNKALKLPAIQSSGSVLRCLPYFYLIGQAKCGTTDIFSRITHHPSVLPPITKEPFWVFPLRFQKGCSSMETYLDFLQTSSNRIRDDYLAHNVSSLITGDGSTTTMSGNTWWNMLPGNEGCREPCITNANIVRHMNPNAKILVSLRNPTSRSFSYYIMKARVLKYTISKEHFHNLVFNEISEFQNCMSHSSLRSCVMNTTEENYLTTATPAMHDVLISPEHQVPSVIASGSLKTYDLFRIVKRFRPIGLRSSIYHIHLVDWLKAFPRDQIHVVHFEHYIRHVEDTLAGVYKFLQVGSLSDKEMKYIAGRRIKNERTESGKQLGDMWPETRVLLNNFFKPFNEQLASLLNNDAFKWTP